MKVKLNKMSLVANWSWQLGDNDHCTICMNPFECACPQCKFPGDDCPPIEGKCGHIFHLHCIYKWLDSGTDKCPLDREIWKEKTESEVNNRTKLKFTFFFSLFLIGNNLLIVNVHVFPFWGISGIILKSSGFTK